MIRTSPITSLLCRVSVIWLLLASWPLFCGSAWATIRIKDVTTVGGVRINQLTGLGLVTGLNGTGGTSPVTRQFAANLTQRFGLRLGPMQRLAVEADTKLRTDNLSVVTVTANMPVFSRNGSQMDVIVSTFDDAESLQGGTLMVTLLYGVDGCVYAVASGPVSVGGFSFGGDAATVQKNYPTTGRVSGGATIEKEVPYQFGAFGQFRLHLRQPDFNNSSRIAQAINDRYPGTASAEDATTIRVLLPPEFHSDHVAFVGAVRSLTISPDLVAKIVINERTGTVIVGERVRISPVAITHANLAVITGETPEVSQPAPFSQGVTAVVPRTQLDVIEERRPVHVIPATSTVGDLAAALNVLGVTPRDLSAIFQQLRAAGALHAELDFQ